MPQRLMRCSNRALPPQPEPSEEDNDDALRSTETEKSSESSSESSIEFSTSEEPSHEEDLDEETFQYPEEPHIEKRTVQVSHICFGSTLTHSNAACRPCPP
jgi:hypothetical protein